MGTLFRKGRYFIIKYINRNLMRYIIVRNILLIEHEKLGILYGIASIKGAENGNICSNA